KVNDSLKFLTLSGRTVYGGGGIMPDYFVPLDTTLNSHYLNELYTTYTLQEYSFNYAEKNKTNLEAMSFDEFLKKFVVTDQMLKELAEAGERNKIKADYSELRKKKRLFQ